MTSLENAIIGYAAGLFVGVLISVFIIGGILVLAGMRVPATVQDLQKNIIETHYQSSPEIFTLAFILGVLTGIGLNGKTVIEINS